MNVEKHNKPNLTKIFLTLSPIGYLVSVISLTIHEFGHIWVSRLFGSISNKLYIAPNVVGSASWHTVEEISTTQRNLITMGGPAVEIAFGFFGFVLAVVLAKRSQHWLVGALAGGSLMTVAYGGGYVLISPILKWGDGYALINRGVPVYAFVIFGLLLGLAMISLFPIAIELLSEYFHISSFLSIWLILMGFMLVPQLYALPKAILFFPDHVTRKLIYVGVISIASLLLAILINTFAGKSEQKSSSPTRQIKPAAIILLWALAILTEVGYTYIFGLQGERLPLFS